MSRSFGVAVLVLACGGCDLLGGGDGDTMMYECHPTETPLGLDDPALGTTVAEVGSAMDGVFVHSGTWADGTAVDATVDFALDLDAAMLVEGGCGTHIAIPATAVIDTADGTFDALTFAFTLEVVDGGGLGGWAMIAPAEVTGTWSPRALQGNENRRGVSLRVGGLVGSPTVSVSDEVEGSNATAAWEASEPILELGEGTLAATP